MLRRKGSLATSRESEKEPLGRRVSVRDVSRATWPDREKVTVMGVRGGVEGDCRRGDGKKGWKRGMKKRTAVL